MADVHHVRIVLKLNYANANWRLKETAVSYEDLEWFDTSVPKPTSQEITDQYNQYTSSLWKDEHKVRRQAQYPSTDELVVALWEKLVEQDGLSSEYISALQARRMEVKANNPKFASKEDADTPLN